MKFLCTKCNCYFSDREMIQDNDGSVDCLPCWFTAYRYDCKKVDALYRNYPALVSLIGKGPRYGEPATAPSAMASGYARFSPAGMRDYAAVDEARIALWHVLITERLGCKHPTGLLDDDFVLVSSSSSSSSSSPHIPVGHTASSTRPFFTPTLPHYALPDQKGREMGYLSRDIYSNASSGILCPMCLAHKKKRVPLSRCYEPNHPRW